VLLLLPHGAEKASTGAVYAAFDARDGAAGFEQRRDALLAALPDLAALPPNDLASSPLARELRANGAFRADVSGAGPTLYGLFETRAAAEAAADALEPLGRLWLSAPAW
jgi:4-diphosphocytidyl-2C-methyl-D-erythritol kinase